MYVPLRRNLIPPERRIYIKPEDLSSLPKKIHVYRGVLGGLYIDREELKRYKSEITDEKLLSRISSGEEDVEVAEEEKIDSFFVRYMNDDLDEETAEEVIDEFVVKRLAPMVKKGKGSMEKIEKEIESLNVFLSFCGEKGIDVRVDDEIVQIARKMIEDDKFEVGVDDEGKKVIESMIKVDDVIEFLDDFSRLMDEEDILIDCLSGENEVFEEIFDEMRKCVNNLALAWRLSRVFYLMMIRSSDDGNYSASRVIEEALAEIIDGLVRPKRKVVDKYSYEREVGEEDVIDYVDVKSVVCWLLVNEILKEKGKVVVKDKLYRGLNSVEELLMYSEIVKKPDASLAVFRGNMLTSFTNNIDVAFDFSSKVIEVSVSDLKGIFGGYWNSVERYKKEEEIVGIIGKDGVRCKVMDKFGSVEDVLKSARGEANIEEIESAFYELCMSVRVNDDIICKCMSEEEIKEKFSELVGLIDDLYENLVSSINVKNEEDKFRLASVNSEMKEIRNTGIYSCVKGV